jgi:hypothetical protein
MNSKKNTNKINDTVIVYSPNPNHNNFTVKAKIIYDEDFEDMIESLMSTELVYGSDNYY